jgi:hypothetical protein
MKVSPAWRRAASALLVIAALGFLGREIVRSAAGLRSFEWHARPGLLVVSVLALSAVFLWGVAVWRMTLAGFGVDAPFRPLARAWFIANLGRYIPGVVWQFLSLAQLGPAAGLSPVVAVTSLLVQMGFLFLSALLLGVYFIPPEAAGFLSPALPALRWAAPVALLLVHPRVIRTVLELVSRVTRRPMLPWNGSWAGGVKLLLLAALTWAMYGVAFYLFLLAFVDVPASTIPALTAMNALAWVVGYLVFFAPGGLGYKELALAALLATVVPRPVAFALAVAARLWTVAGELLPAAFLLRRGAAVDTATRSD